jgi:hypothetical protein
MIVGMSSRQWIGIERQRCIILSLLHHIDRNQDGRRDITQRRLTAGVCFRKAASNRLLSGCVALPGATPIMTA